MTSPCIRGQLNGCHTCGATDDEACPFADLTPGLLESRPGVKMPRDARICDAEVCESCQ